MTHRRTKDLDIVIGQKIRAARMARGFSQADLGRAIGVTFQQVQKYENGHNRIAVSTLIPICSELGVDPATLLPRVMVDGSPAPDPMAALGATIGGYRWAKAYTDLDEKARASVMNITDIIIGNQAQRAAA